MKKIRLLERTFPKILYSDKELIFNIDAISHIIQSPDYFSPSDSRVYVSIIKFVGSDKEYMALTEDLEKLILQNN